MVERRLADRVSVLTANNDAVTLDLDAATHLPIQRTFARAMRSSTTSTRMPRATTTTTPFRAFPRP